MAAWGQVPEEAQGMPQVALVADWVVAAVCEVAAVQDVP